MKTNLKTVVTLMAMGLFFSCKQAHDENAEAANASNSESVEAVTDSAATSPSDTKTILSSQAAKEPKNNPKKFVRTATARFKVKDVVQSTYSIENAVATHGGYVTHTHLESRITDQDETKISSDSTLITTRYEMTNDITLRIPNTQLDPVLTEIAKEMDFINERTIDADDVTLQLLANKMAQKRSSETEKRMATGIDSKGKKLDQVMQAEETLAQKKEENNQHQLANLDLQDKVSYSTLTLHIYQNEALRREKIGNLINRATDGPHLGTQVWQNFTSGWYFVENVIAFLVLLWPLLLGASLGWFGYRKWVRK